MLKSLATAFVLGAPMVGFACDPGPNEPVRSKTVPFALDKSVLVCVTSRPPVGIDAAQMEGVYGDWVERAADREGYVSSFLFEFEDDGRGAPRVMFALVFEQDPDGFGAANAFKAEAFAEFETVLAHAGFTEISEQSNLLYVDGSYADFWDNYFNP